MKRWIVVLTIAMCLCCIVQGNEPNEPPSGGLIEPNQPGIDKDGFIISVMSMENRDPNIGNLYLRAGYKYGVLEAFGGIEGEKGDIYEFGFLLHSRDVIEPDSVLLISNLLTSFLDEQMVATGYTGLHWVKDRRIKEDYSGAIVGIDAKAKPESPLSIRGEVHYENNKPRDITFYAGLCLRY